MTPKTVHEQARELVDLMQSRYDEHRHDAQFTLWHHALLWDGSQFGKYRDDNPYASFIPALVSNPPTPLCKQGPVPSRRTSPFDHYSALCLYNRSLLEDRVKQLLQEGGCDRVEEALAIISDKKLIGEAATHYVGLKSNQALGESVDFVDYLLRFDCKASVLTEEIVEPRGTFVPLLARLVSRYGEKELEPSIFSNCPESVRDSAQVYHERAINYKRSQASIKPEILALYTKYAASLDTNGYVDRTCAPTVRGTIEGKRKVPIRRATAFLDWASMMQRRVASYRGPESIPLNEVLMARARRAITNDAMRLIKQSGGLTDAAMEDLSRKLSEASSEEEQKVLKTVIGVVHIIGGFQSFQTIYHTMPVVNKRMRR